MILKIIDCKKKPFKTDDGEMKDYFWIRAEGVNGYVKTYGCSTDLSGFVGEKADYMVEQRGTETNPRYVILTEE